MYLGTDLYDGLPVDPNFSASNGCSRLAMAQFGEASHRGIEPS